MSDWVIHFIESGGYWGILCLMALENIIPPIPSELIMGVGGMAVARGTMQFWPLLFAGSVGSTLGNLFWFAVGQRVGYQRLQPWIERWGRWLTVDWGHVEGASAFFRQHGQWVIFASRFSPVMRTMLSLPAGLTQMHRWRFILFTFAGTTIWNVILIHGGQLVERYLRGSREMMGWIALALALLALGWYAWRVATWKPRG